MSLACRWPCRPGSSACRQRAPKPCSCCCCRCCCCLGTAACSGHECRLTVLADLAHHVDVGLLALLVLSEALALRPAHLLQHAVPELARVCGKERRRAQTNAVASLHRTCRTPAHATHVPRSGDAQPHCPRLTGRPYLVLGHRQPRHLHGSPCLWLRGARRRVQSRTQSAACGPRPPLEAPLRAARPMSQLWRVRIGQGASHSGFWNFCDSMQPHTVTRSSASTNA